MLYPRSEGLADSGWARFFLLPCEDGVVGAVLLYQDELWYSAARCIHSAVKTIAHSWTEETYRKRK